MIKYIFIIATTFLILLITGESKAIDYNAVWQKGANYFKNKQYDSAAMCFEQLSAQKTTNAMLYYNLGNAYYRMNIVPKAILNYERALWLNPDLKDAKDNLLLTQTRIKNKIPDAGQIFFIKWWNALTRSDRAASWAIAAAIVFFIIVVILLFNRLKKTDTGVPIPGQVPFILGCIWFAMLGLAYAASLHSTDSELAVVMQNDVPLMNIDFKGKPLGNIPEGTTVHVKTVKGDLAEISLPDGRTGWLQMQYLEKV